MFAINHAAASLIFKKHLKDEVSFIWILVAVQFVEFLWVGLNLLGIEAVTTEKTVNYVGDIHLSYMPYSHSILSSLVIAVVAGIGFWLWKRSWRVGILMALAFSSHIILDILTHAKDLPLGFGNSNFVGLELYSSLPFLGFIIELSFGLFCWWYYGRDKLLFWIILLFNLANLSMFLPQIPGLESYMANRPTLLVFVILAQILVTLTLIGWATTRKSFIKA